jgi:hypothetical protein
MRQSASRAWIELDWVLRLTLNLAFWADELEYTIMAHAGPKILLVSGWLV